jgi:hypothetical protein
MHVTTNAGALARMRAGGDSSGGGLQRAGSSERRHQALEEAVKHANGSHRQKGLGTVRARIPAGYSVCEVCGITSNSVRQGLPADTPAAAAQWQQKWRTLLRSVLRRL